MKIKTKPIMVHVENFLYRTKLHKYLDEETPAYAKKLRGENLDHGEDWVNAENWILHTTGFILKGLFISSIAAIVIARQLTKKQQR